MIQSRVIFIAVEKELPWDFKTLLIFSASNM